MSNGSKALQSLELIQDALNASAIVAITDPAGTILWVNHKFCEISGYSESELIGENHRILKSGHHSPEFYRDLWTTISSGRKWEGQLKNRRKDGTFYWVQTFIVPFLGAGGRVREYVSIRWDITIEKQEEENLSALMDSALEGLLVYDLSGQVVWNNRRAAEILDADNEHVLIGQYFQRLFADAIAPFEEGRTDIQLQGSEIKSLEVTVRPFHWQGHRAYLVSFRDMTERSRLEARLLQHERLASAGMLASGLAHEIGTPLGVMRARAELALMESSLPSKTQETLNVIVSQIDRISGLMRSLLSLSRENGSGRLEALSIDRTVSSTLEFLSHEFQRQEIEIRREVDPLHRVLGSENALFQVLLNLLMNAMHAVGGKPAGEPRVITIRSSDLGDQIEVRVEDNGTGMSPEVRRRLFQPFFTTKDPGQGTGLGLATSLKILRSWGGDIEVESELGIGSLFRLRLRKAIGT